MIESRKRAASPRAKLRELQIALASIVCLTAVSAHADVSVRDAQLVRHGRPWLPHGVVQIAFVAPLPPKAAYSPRRIAATRQRIMRRCTA